MSSGISYVGRKDVREKHGIPSAVFVLRVNSLLSFCQTSIKTFYLRFKIVLQLKTTNIKLYFDLS